MVQKALLYPPHRQAEFKTYGNDFTRKETE